MRHHLPFARPGQVIGLLGGSFDPAHRGHVHITKEALRRFGLDRVWWLVSPGNPLKAEGPAPLDRRMHRAKEVMQHPRVDITDIEAQLGTRYTAATLQEMMRIYPGVRFVWLMGADNLTQFDQWKDWHWIMNSVPVGVLARPGDRISARTSKAAQIYRAARIRGRNSHLLGVAKVPAWCFVNMPMVDQSSTALRAAGAWTR
jgi:nicotinate-nucleotide adenylyltransferase